MKDVMIDLETWGNKNNALVVQIGACYFDRYKGNVGNMFSEHVNAIDEMANGFEADASTIYWWLERDKEAQRVAHGREQNRLSSFVAWNKFNNFLKDATNIWSHGTFDYVILNNHLDKLKIKPNFNHRAGKDIRTLTDLVGYFAWPKRDGVHHNALDDCLYQVSYVVPCINKLKGA